MYLYAAYRSFFLNYLSRGYSSPFLSLPESSAHGWLDEFFLPQDEGYFHRHRAYLHHNIVICETVKVCWLCIFSGIKESQCKVRSAENRTFPTVPQNLPLLRSASLAVTCVKWPGVSTRTRLFQSSICFPPDSIRVHQFKNGHGLTFSKSISTDTCAQCHKWRIHAHLEAPDQTHRSLARAPRNITEKNPIMVYT